jgi:energy-converting hydrogenase Eha subunit F
MSEELNKDQLEPKTEPEVKISEDELADFEITEEEMDDVSGGRMPAFVRADYPHFFAKNS